MNEETYVYLLWETYADGERALHGVYANRDDAHVDALMMARDTNNMSVETWRVDYKAVA